MKKFALFFVIINLLTIQTSHAAISEKTPQIEAELAQLQGQLDQLNAIIKDYRLKEMKEEIHGQYNMLSYDWRKLSESSQKAEFYEEEAEKLDLEAEKIRERIKVLSERVNALTPTNKK